MENKTVRDSDSDSDTNTSESHPGPDGACSAIYIPSEDKERKNASPVSLENQIVKDSNSDSDSNSCESKPSPGDTGTTAVVEIAVCSSGETLKESSLSETSEEEKEINGNKDYSMIKDKDDPQDDLSIKAEVGGTSSKSPDDKDYPRNLFTTTMKNVFSKTIVKPVTWVFSRFIGNSFTTTMKNVFSKTIVKPVTWVFSRFIGAKPLSPKKPGKPYHTDVSSDNFVLGWISPDSEDVIYYEIKYKTIHDVMWCKTSVITDDNTTCFVVGGLQQNTGYICKVRPHYQDGEGEFSEDSDPIHTPISPAVVTRNEAVKIKDGEPAIYKLPLQEKDSARSATFRTRKCEFGKQFKIKVLITKNTLCVNYQEIDQYKMSRITLFFLITWSSDMLDEKNIMMIGATGAGKSTLIDGMMNYLLGVKWKDDFRFQISDQMDDEKERQGKETESQTDWITSYRVHPKNDKVKFICNLIDTPGFGDTRGIERDHQLVEQIRALFDTKGVTGIETIDAVCVVTQAPLARLTHTQRYIYDSILSIFGKDIGENMVAMVTFADGKEPPVLGALRQAEVPMKEHFLFNNSALFAVNTSSKSHELGKMFWDMGNNIYSYQQFFAFLPTTKTKSLQLTSKVLRKREQMNAMVVGLLPQIDKGLHELSEMRKERELAEKLEREIKDNKDFTYETVEIHQRKEKLDPGTHVTNCITCNFTCHSVCGISDNNKYNCAVMENGKCTVCPGKCSYDVHTNNQFRIVAYEQKVQKSYNDMKKKFDSAKEGKSTKESILRGTNANVLAIKDKVVAMLDEVRKCGNYIREFAIKSNPLTEVEYLEVQIQSELKQKKRGFEERVKMFEGLKRRAELKAKCIELSPEELMTAMGLNVEGID